MHLPHQLHSLSVLEQATVQPQATTFVTALL